MNLNNQIRLTEDIVLYENFLTPEEAAKTIKILDHQVDSEKLQWTPISFYESYSSVLPEDNDEDLERFDLPATFFSEIKDGIIEGIASVHKIEKEQVVQIGYHTQKWEPGAYARIHSDNTDEHGNSGPFERSRYAAFLYLNEDFEGGLLRFPDQDITIEPKTGMLAVFAGGFKNMHEVTLITSGIRYTLGSFWDDRPESAYPEELREEWKQQMKKIREDQEAEKAKWQELIKNGYKIDENGNTYKIKETD